jgi:hypothetical protein
MYNYNMLNKRITQKNYTNNCEVYQLVFPVETGIVDCNIKCPKFQEKYNVKL